MKLIETKLQFDLNDFFVRSSIDVRACCTAIARLALCVACVECDRAIKYSDCVCVCFIFYLFYYYFLIITKFQMPLLLCFVKFAGGYSNGTQPSNYDVALKIFCDTALSLSSPLSSSSSLLTSLNGGKTFVYKFAFSPHPGYSPMKYELSR